MKNQIKIAFISFTILLIASWGINAQVVMDTTDMVKDSMVENKMIKYAFPIRIDVRGYNNTLNSNRKLLASNGYLLDQEAFEVGIKFGYLPKIYYFQQLGTLSKDGNFPSVIGFGLKDRLSLNIIKPTSHFILTPYLELGLGYYKMNFYRGVASNTIQNVVKGNVSHDAIDAFTATIDLGLNMGFWFELANRKISIVANGGYLVNSNDQWRLGSALAFKEKLNLSSPYVGFSLGISML